MYRKKLRKENFEKELMKIQFSFEMDSISAYLDDGWTNLKENSQEKICTLKSPPTLRDCDIEKEK